MELLGYICSIRVYGKFVHLFKIQCQVPQHMYACIQFQMGLACASGYKLFGVDLVRLLKR